MLESQWLEKSDEEVDQALRELDLYTPEARRVILAESRRRKLDERIDTQEAADVEARVVAGSGSAFTDLFTARGRLSRLSYLGRIVGCTVFSLVLGWAAAASRSPGQPLASGALLVLSLLWICILEVEISASIRRCHDMNQSGYWLLLYTFIPFAGFMLVLRQEPLDLRIGLSIIFAIAFAGLVLVFRKGTKGVNRFDLGSSTVATEFPGKESSRLGQHEGDELRRGEGAMGLPLRTSAESEPVTAYPEVNQIRNESRLDCVPVREVRAPKASPDEASATELLFWDSIKASNSSADFQAYLERYPNGAFAVLARNRLEQVGTSNVEADGGMEA